MTTVKTFTVLQFEAKNYTIIFLW